MRSSDIKVDKTTRTRSLLREVTGYNVTGASLYAAVTARYKSWNWILTSVRKFHRRVKFDSRYWSKRTIIRAIRALNRNAVPLNSNRLQYDKSSKLVTVIFRSTGIRTNGAILYYRARQEFSTWDNALKKAGLNPNAIRHRGVSIKESGLTFEKILRVLSNNKIALNAKSIKKNSNFIRDVIYREFEKPVSGESLYWTARRGNGTWTSVLKKSGFNPDEIVLYQRGSWALNVIPHQVELVITSDGRVSKSAFLGAAPKLADEIIEIQSIADGLEAATTNLSVFDQKYLPKIFDLILEVDDYSNQEDLAEQISERMNYSLSAANIQRILKSLAKYPALMDLR